MSGVPVANYHFECDRTAILKKIQGRKCLFFDMSIWIPLTECKDADSQAARDRLDHLVADGKVFCPFSAVTMWELTKQAQDSRLRVAEVIEKLSLNTAMANRDSVFGWELGDLAVGLIANTSPATRTKIIVPAAYYLSSSYSLTFNDDQPERERLEMAKRLRTKLESTSLVELVKLRGTSVEDMRKLFIPPPYGAAGQQARKLTGGNKDKLRRLEAEVVTRTYITPFIEKLPLEAKKVFLQRLNALPSDAYGGVLGSLWKWLPSIRNFAEIMATIGQEPSRVDNPNDMFDMEMLPVPLAYADALVVRDKRVRNLLEKRSPVLGMNSCRFVPTIGELVAYLRAI